MLANIVIEQLGIDKLVHKLETAAETHEYEGVNDAVIQSEAGPVDRQRVQLKPQADGHYEIARQWHGGGYWATCALRWKAWTTMSNACWTKRIGGTLLSRVLGCYGCLHGAPCPGGRVQSLRVCDIADPEARSAMPVLAASVQRELRGTVVAQSLGVGSNSNDLFVQAMQSSARSRSATGHLQALEDGVHRSGAVLLLLTKEVLRRPTTLLLIFEAISQGKPVVSLFITEVAMTSMKARRCSRSCGAARKPQARAVP